jgi:hypothetical protein
MSECGFVRGRRLKRDKEEENPAEREAGETEM